MKDQLGREINYMRISITDRCNLRCRYCMPQGIKLLPREELLTLEEIITICNEAVSLGITNFKITGGEPLVRKDCAFLVKSIKQIPGVEQVTLTTNGVYLSEQIKSLSDAGIDGINVSLDTLNPEIFQKITGFDQLSKVQEGIRLAVEAHIPTKINCVLQEGLNKDEWKAMIAQVKNKPIDLRFIELMPIGAGAMNAMVSNEWLLNQLQKYEPKLYPDYERHGNGPAVYYKIPGYQGSIGLISAIHGKFCNQCNRIRLTAEGELKPCLCYKETISLRNILRNGTRKELREMIGRAIINKPKMHCFEDKDRVSEERKMVQIGG